MSEMTPETLPTMPYSEGTRTCAKACMAVLSPDDVMYQWLQIYLEHTAALQARIEALETCREVLSRADKNMGVQTWKQWWKDRAAALAKEKP